MKKAIDSIRLIRGIVLKAVVLDILGGLIFGYATGVISGALISLENTFDLKRDWTITPDEIITSALILGATLGSLSAGQISHFSGRKLLLIISSIFSGIGATLYLALSPNWINVTVARFLQGICVGIYSAIAPLHLSECSPKEIRGLLGTFFQLSITFAIFIGALMAFITATDSWRFLFGACIIFTIPMLFASIWMEESPHFLISKNKIEKARRALITIVGEENVEKEIQNIKSEIDKEKISWRIALSKAYKIQLIIGIVLCFAQQLTGINAMIYYIQQILENAGLEDKKKKTGVSAAILFWNFLTTFGATFFTEKFGRRRLVLIGLIIMGFPLILAGAIFYTNNPQVVLGFVIVCILIFILGFEIGVGPLFWIVINEIYPENIRSRIASIMTGIQWLFNFLLSLFFRTINRKLGGEDKSPRGNVFFIFAGIDIVTIIILWFLLPETKGKSFKEIQDAMNPNKGKLEQSEKVVEEKEQNFKE